jgi:acyl-CoA reductase-like NAD-dependent aldehyde dehydrogenase
LSSPTPSSSLHNFVHGRAAASPGARIPLVSPIDLEVVAEIPEAPLDVVDIAVDVASAAYAMHRGSTVAQRSKWLREAAAGLERELPALVVLDE